jgi:hypothetical protein
MKTRLAASAISARTFHGCGAFPDRSKQNGGAGYWIGPSNIPNAADDAMQHSGTV